MLVDDAGEAIVCGTCGRALDDVDPDEDPTGYEGRAICGTCYRNLNDFMYEISPDD